jgi:hypothetical protein
MIKKIRIIPIYLIGFIFLCATFLAIINSYKIQNAYWSWRAFVEPNVSDRIENEWRTKSTVFLLKKLDSKVFIYWTNAMTLLLERKETKAIPILVKITKSKDDQTRISAFIALGQFGDTIATKYMLDIVKEGQTNPDYINALRSLSYSANNEAFYPIIALAQSKMGDSLYNERAYAINMLERYQNKPETLEVLRKIAASDAEEYIRQKAQIAIAKITKDKNFKS